MESLAPIGAAPMYTLIYNYTLDKYPGAFNFFSAIIYLYCILLITWVYFLTFTHTRNKFYIRIQKIENKNETNEQKTDEKLNLTLIFNFFPM